MKAPVPKITWNVIIPLPGYAIMNVLHAGSGPEAVLADLVGDLYAAASGERTWETALTPLGRMLGGTSGILFVDDPACADVDLLALPGWSAAAVALYAARYRSLDPRSGEQRNGKPMFGVSFATVHTSSATTTNTGYATSKRTPSP